MTIDQVVSGASNLMVLVWCAHVASPSDFGRFSLLSLAYAVGLGVTHSLVSVPAVAHPEDVDSRPWLVLGSAFIVAVILAVPCALGAAVLLSFDPATAKAGLVLTAMLPFLLLLNVSRYVAFARAQPWRAVVIDAVWLVLAAGAIAWCLASDVSSLTVIVLVWTGTGAVSTATLFFLYGAPSALSTSWLREHWHFSWRALVGNLAATVGGLLGAVGVALVSSPVTVAAVRAAMLLRRPGQVLQGAISTTIANDVARAQPDRVGVRRYQRRALVLASIAAILNLAVLILLPDSLGRLFLGRVWALVDPLRLPIGLVVVALASQAGVRAVLLGRRQISTIAFAEIAGMVIGIPVLILGAALGGSTGAMWALVIGTASISLAWWILLLRYLNRLEKSEATDSEATS